MPLEGIVEKLGSKLSGMYNRVLTKIELYSLAYGPASNSSKSPKRSRLTRAIATTLIPSFVGLPLLFSKKDAYAQVETLPTNTSYNTLESNLQGNNIALVNSFYEQNFGFVPSDISNIQIGTSNFILVKNPETGNLFYREFNLDGIAQGEAAEILNTASITGFTALNYDSIEGDEFAVVYHSDENKWRLYSVNDFQEFLSDLKNRNGAVLDGNVLAELFNLPSQPQNAFSINADNRGNDDGIVYSQGNNINSNDASFRDNYGNIHDARDLVRDLERRIRAIYPNFNEDYRISVVKDKLVFIERVQPSILPAPNTVLPTQLTTDENTPLQNAFRVNPSLEYRITGNENIRVVIDANGYVSLIPIENFNGTANITMTGINRINGLSTENYNLELRINPVNTPPRIEVPQDALQVDIGTGVNLNNIVRVTDRDTPLSQVITRYRVTFSPEETAIADGILTPRVPGRYVIETIAFDGTSATRAEIVLNAVGKIVDMYVRHYSLNEAVENAQVIIGPGSCRTNANGNCRINLPASFSGIQDILILADEENREVRYAKRGFQYQFNPGSGLYEIIDKIVPVEKPLTPEQEGNDPYSFPWRLYNAVARFIGGRTFDFPTYALATREPNNPDALNIEILTDNSRTRQQITPEMIQLVEGVIVSLYERLSGGLTTTPQDIIKNNQPFSTLTLPTRPTLRLRWEDLENAPGAGGYLHDGYYINTGMAVLAPDGTTEGIATHELLLASGFHEPRGELDRIYGPRESIFNAAGGTRLTRPTALDNKIIDFRALRGSGNTTREVTINGQRHNIIDYSPRLQ